MLVLLLVLVAPLLLDVDDVEVLLLLVVRPLELFEPPFDVCGSWPSRPSSPKVPRLPGPPEHATTRKMADAAVKDAKSATGAETDRRGMSTLPKISLSTGVDEGESLA